MNTIVIAPTTFVDLLVEVVRNKEPAVWAPLWAEEFLGEEE